MRLGGESKLTFAEKKGRAYAQNFPDLCHGLDEDFVRRGGRDNAAGEPVESLGALFAPALVAFLGPDAGGKLSRDQRDDKEDSEHQAVFQFPDIERVERRDKKIIPE